MKIRQQKMEILRLKSESFGGAQAATGDRGVDDRSVLPGRALWEALFVHLGSSQRATRLRVAVSSLVQLLLADYHRDPLVQVFRHK